jgi:outer membrane lipoprotein-sorting protein
MLLLAIPAGCISRKRVVPETERLLPAQTATRADLLHLLEEKSRQIQTLQATLALDAAGGGIKTGVLTEYRQTKGFLLVDRPNNIRLKVQAVLALATVVDMVSDGRQYRVSVPIKNKFLIGDVSAPAKEKNPILNLRPQHLMKALFVDVTPYLNHPEVRSTFEEITEGRRSFYVFTFINVGPQDAQVIEKLWIDRYDLQVSRKQLFRNDGKVDTYVEYSDYASLGEISFPEVIFMQRPIDDLNVKMTLQKTTVNEKLVTDAFSLERPAGSELVQLEADDSSGSRPF